jgi:hypothetical protein
MTVSCVAGVRQRAFAGTPLMHIIGIACAAPEINRALD